MLRNRRSEAYVPPLFTSRSEQVNVTSPLSLPASSCEASNMNKSLTFCKWVGICSNAADEREDENMSADNTDPDTAAACCSTAGNMSYKSLHL